MTLGTRVREILSCSDVQWRSGDRNLSLESLVTASTLVASLLLVAMSLVDFAKFFKDLVPTLLQMDCFLETSAKRHVGGSSMSAPLATRGCLVIPRSLGDVT